MIYKYLPCQILGHDFDEKSEFLDHKLPIKLPAITQFKNGQVQKRVGSREDVTNSGCSNSTNKDLLSNCSPLNLRQVKLFLIGNSNVL